MSEIEDIEKESEKRRKEVETSAVRGEFGIPSAEKEQQQIIIYPCDLITQIVLDCAKLVCKLAGIYMQSEMSTALGHGSLSKVMPGIVAATNKLIAIKIVPGEVLKSCQCCQFASVYRALEAISKPKKHQQHIECDDVGSDSDSDDGISYVEWKNKQPSFYIVQVDRVIITPACQGLFIILMERLNLRMSDYIDALRSSCNSSQLEEEARRCAGHIGSALRYLNVMGIAHRNISPGNIFVRTIYRQTWGNVKDERESVSASTSTLVSDVSFYGGSDEPSKRKKKTEEEISTPEKRNSGTIYKLGGFGYAKFTTSKKEGETVRWNETRLGVPLLNAPEQFTQHQQPDDITPASSSASSSPEFGPEIDLWQLGMCLCFILANGVPSRETVLKSIKNHAVCIELPDDIHVSDNCRDCISRLLTLDPTKRMNAEQLLFHPWLLLPAQPSSRSSLISPSISPAL